MRQQKITFGEMRSGGGPTGILVYCADYRCSHSMEMSADPWPDDVRLTGHVAGPILKRGPEAVHGRHVAGVPHALQHLIHGRVRQAAASLAAGKNEFSLVWEILQQGVALLGQRHYVIPALPALLALQLRPPP